VRHSPLYIVDCSRTHIIGLKGESAYGGGNQSMRTDHCSLSLKREVSNCVPQPLDPGWIPNISFRALYCISCWSKGLHSLRVCALYWGWPHLCCPAPISLLSFSAEHALTYNSCSAWGLGVQSKGVECDRVSEVPFRHLRLVVEGPLCAEHGNSF